MFHCGMVGVVFGSCLYLQEYEQGDVETKRQILSIICSPRHRRHCASAPNVGVPTCAH